MRALANSVATAGWKWIFGHQGHVVPAEPEVCMRLGWSELHWDLLACQASDWAGLDSSCVTRAIRTDDVQTSLLLRLYSLGDDHSAMQPAVALGPVLLVSFQQGGTQ